MMVSANLSLDIGHFNIGHLQQCPMPNAQCLTDLWERLQSLDAQLLSVLLGQLPTSQPIAPFAVQFYRALIAGTGSDTAPMVTPNGTDVASDGTPTITPPLAEAAFAATGWSENLTRLVALDGDALTNAVSSALSPSRYWSAGDRAPALPVVSSALSPSRYWSAGDRAPALPVVSSALSPSLHPSSLIPARTIQALIVQTAQRYGVDPALALAVAKAESNFDPNAVSPKGAMGVMQLMPETAKALGVHNAFDPVQNIDGGIRYLRQLIDLFGGRVELAVAAYNAGPNAVRRYGGVPPYPETQSFERCVLTYWEQFKQQLITKARHSSPLPKDLPIQPDSVPMPKTVDVRAGHASPLLPKDLPLLPDNAPTPKTVDMETGLIPIPRNPTGQLQELSIHSAADTVCENDAGGGNQTVSRGDISRDPNIHQPNFVGAKHDLLLPLLQPSFDLSSRASSISTAPDAPSSVSDTNILPGQSTATVHRLTAEIPTPDNAEPLRLRLTMHTKPEETAVVQVAVRTSDERLAALLQTEVPSLRQQLWLHGIALAQFTVSDSARDGVQRDPHQSERPARRLSSVPRATRPLLSLDTNDGVWA